MFIKKSVYLLNRNESILVQARPPEILCSSPFGPFCEVDAGVDATEVLWNRILYI